MSSRVAAAAAAGRPAPAPRTPPGGTTEGGVDLVHYGISSRLPAAAPAPLTPPGSAKEGVES